MENNSIRKSDVDLVFNCIHKDIEKLHQSYQGDFPVLEIQSIIDYYKNGILSVGEYATSDVMNEYFDVFQRQRDVCVKSKGENLANWFIKDHRFGELAESFTESPLARRLSGRDDVWQDFLITERSYHYHLKATNDMFIQIEANGRILNDKISKKIFQNIKEIYHITVTMWQNLENAFLSWPECQPMIGDIFLKEISQLTKEYAVYINGFPRALKTLLKLKKNNSEFYDFVKNIPIKDISRNMEIPLPIHCLLLLPVCRAFEYESYIKQLKDLTSPSHDDFESLVVSEMKMVELNRNVFENKNYLLRISKILNLVSSSHNPRSEARAAFLHLLLKESEYIPRSYVREGFSAIIDDTLRPCFIYLFTDMLIVCDMRGNDEKYFSELYPLHGILAEDVIPPAYANHTICVSCLNGKKIVLSFSTEPEKKSWLEDINFQSNEKNIEIQIPKVTPRGEVPKNFSQSFLQGFSNLFGNSDIYAVANVLPEKLNFKIEPEDEPIASGIFSSESEIKLQGVSGRGISLLTGYPNDISTTCSKVDVYQEHLVFACATATAKMNLQFAIKEFFKSISKLEALDNVRELGREYLRVLDRIHREIIERADTTRETGMLSFLGGIMVIPEDKNTRIFIGVSIGSYNLYLWSGKKNEAREIAPENDVSYSQSFDGGLGSYYTNGTPSLSGLKLYVVTINEDDTIVAVSSGIHENMDPKNTGITHEELLSFMGSNRPNLSDLSESEMINIARSYKEKTFTNLMQNYQHDPEKMTKKLVKHVEKITKKRRDFKSQYPKRREPRNKKLCPGILSDAFALAIEGFSL